MTAQTGARAAARAWISRRRVLGRLAVGGAGLMATAVGGCWQEGEPAAPTQAAAQPKRGGILTRLTPSTGVFAVGFDPHVISGASETGHMGLFYQTLVRYNPRTYDPEPELAQRWEQPSPTDYIFTLAPGARWQNKPPVNGRDVTAEDVVFSLRRAGTNEPRFVNRALLADIDRIEAVDKQRVRITTKAPDVTTLANLAFASLAILAPEVVERAGKFATPETAVGTGAFILQSMDEVSATLVRNPDYWKPGLPYLDGVKLVHIRDEQAQWGAFLAGQLDIVIVPGAEVKQFLAEQAKNYRVEWFKDNSVQHLWQNTRRKPFDDARVNRALRLLMDHTEFIKGWVEVWFGPGSGVYISHLPHALDAWDFPQEEYVQARTPLFLEWKQPKDEAVREAVRLLNAAGFTRDNPLKFALRNNTTPSTGQAMGQLLQAQYHRLGQGMLQVELRLTDNTTLSTDLVQGNFEVAGPTARGFQVDPDLMFSDIYHSKGGRNFGKYTDPKLDEMIERQRGMFDRAQRKAAVTEIMTYLIRNAPYVGPCSRDQLNAAQAKVKNFAPENPASLPGFQYEHIWLDT